LQNFFPQFFSAIIVLHLCFGLKDNFFFGSPVKK